MTFPKLTVLILEDTSADAELIADALRSASIDFDVVQVGQEQEFHRLLQKTAPDLIFADHDLVATHEESALAVSRRLHPTVPFIFIADTPGEEAAVEAVRSGATDYVLKQRLPRLGFVVHRALWERHQVQTMPPNQNTTEHGLCKPNERKHGGKQVNKLNQLDQARRNAEARLQLLDSALRSAANAIAITDRQGCLLWINPAFTRLTGYTLEEAYGKKPSLLKSGVQDQDFYGHMWKSILAGQVWHSEMVNRRKDGSLFTEECTITPVRDETGEIAHFIAVKQDITDRKQAEETSRWRTAFFEALVDSNLDGILVVDSHGKKILQNRRMNELWKIPPHIADDPADCKQVEFVTAKVKNPQPFAEKVAYLYAHTNEVSRDEVELTDGTVLDRYSSPVQARDGTYYGRIWTFRDITGQRRLEAQFRQAQKMEAIGQLAGGVAHDFNNILTAIMMHLCILREVFVDQETAEALLELEAEAKRAADLTRQLLMFSRKSAIEVRPIDLNQVVEEMLKMLHRLLGENVSVKFRSTAALPLVEADRGMMQQVIMNLSVNGRDAMADGGQLTIATELAEFNESLAGAHPDRRPGSFVHLSVADTGCGMDEATRKRIFEPFFTTKEIGKGTGLGLATVYGIVQQHRGWIEVASEPGKGSVFDVFLPATKKNHSSDASETRLTLRGGKETILLVEDEPTVRVVTARGLQMLGYRVLEATDGQLALELWSRHADSIQLLLTDIIMPNGVSGLDLAERLQKEKPGLQVIITSGYSAEISAHGIPSRPGIQYLPKPFGMPQLMAAVCACLDKK